MADTNPLATGRFVLPEVVATHFHLREGDAVADFGAGSGYFVETLSRLVGSDGRVYACEIQRNLVEKMERLIRDKGLANVDPLWCDLEEAGGVTIKDESLDAVITVNTLFQVESKDVFVAEVHRVLRSGGKFFVIDWSESFGGLGPQPDQVLSQLEAKALIEGQGFVYERMYDAGDHHYGLAFRKA